MRNARLFAPMFLAYLALFSAPALAATPAGSFLTREQLDKIPFTSVADPPFVENALIFPDVKTAILLPQTEFNQGEPICVWLIVKSLNRQADRSLPTGFDLGATGEKPYVEGSARVQLSRLKQPSAPAGDVQPDDIIADLKGKIARTTVRALIPAEGYLVNSGDVRNLAAKPLAPGNYLLRFWSEGQRAQAIFTLSNRAAPTPATIPAPSDLADLSKHEAGVLNWLGAFQGRALPRQGQIRLPLRNGYLSPRTTDDFRMGLAMGMGAGPTTRYYARIADIPSRDDVVAISAKFTHGNPDKLQIILTPAAQVQASQTPAGAAATANSTAPAPARAPSSAPAAAGEDVQFPIYPSLYLLVENLDAPINLRITSERQGAMPSNSSRFNAPIIIDAELPQEWVARLAFTGKARLTVIVAADLVRPGVEQPGESFDLSAYTTPRLPRPTVKRWSGIVRTPPIEFSVKPAASGAPEGGEGEK